MKISTQALGLVMVAVAVSSTTGGCSKAVAQAKQTGATGDRAIELTIYKEDFAMVSEKRPVDLSQGHDKISIDDISKQLDPDSVLFDWSGAASQPEVVATTYDLGVANGSSLLSRLNGQQVEMMWPSNAGKPGEVISGRLEAAQQGDNFALRTPEKLYINPGGTIVAPSSTTASSLPRLSVELENPTAGNKKLGFSYLTRGMSWSADYVARLAPDKDEVALECWATVTNTTGIPYPSAKLTLMTGSPNRSVTRGTVTLSADAMVAGNSFGAAKAPMAGDGEYDRSGRTRTPAMTAVGDMYAYKVPSTATIGQDQMNRVSVLGTKTVPVKRDYAIRIPTLSAWGYYGGEQVTTPHVSATLSISFVNDAASNLGVPLPSGAVRVYEKDNDGQDRYTGAATIADTPKKEHVSLTLANAFDVYGEYRVVSSKKLDKHTVRKSLETIIHNEKKRAVDVRVVQEFDGRWTTVSETDKGRKLDASTSEWIIHVEPGGLKKLENTIDMRV